MNSQKGNLTFEQRVLGALADATNRFKLYQYDYNMFHIILTYVPDVKIDSRLIKTWNEVLFLYKAILSAKNKCIENNQDEDDDLINQLNHVHLELLYRSNLNTDYAKTFHALCDNIEDTILIVRNDKASVFGGFTHLPWTQENKFYEQSNSFLFYLRNDAAANEPERDLNQLFPLRSQKDECRESSIFGSSQYCACFGNAYDLMICDDFMHSKQNYIFPSSYGKKEYMTASENRRMNSLIARKKKEGKLHFKVTGMEVFRCVFRY